MSKTELKFRIEYFWYVFRVWLRGALKRKPKGVKVKKHLVTYGVIVDGVQIEDHKGTFWEFLKWIVTHDSFDNL